jgi:hypothetical protein
MSHPALQRVIAIVAILGIGGLLGAPPAAVAEPTTLADPIYCNIGTVSGNGEPYGARLGLRQQAAKTVRTRLSPPTQLPAANPSWCSPHGR